MKKFYDREREMSLLHDMQQQAFNDNSRFVVLTGRRRVGKTSLVYHLMEDTKEQAPGLYFFWFRYRQSGGIRSEAESSEVQSCEAARESREERKMPPMMIGEGYKLPNHNTK